MHGILAGCKAAGKVARSGSIDMGRGDAVELARCLPGKSVDLAIADPPYGIGFLTNKRKQSTVQGGKGIHCDTSECIVPLLHGMVDELDRVLKDDAGVYVFAKWSKIPDVYPEIARKFDIKNVLVWKKNKSRGGMGDLKGTYSNQYESIIYARKGKKKLNCIDGRCRHPDVIEINRVHDTHLVHSHQKPVELVDFLIRKSSNPGDTVLDPFLGSGTTCIAAKRSGRNCIGFEIDPATFELAVERVNDGSTARGGTSRRQS